MKRFWLTTALTSAAVLAAGLAAGCAPAARDVAAAPPLGQPAAQALHYLNLLTQQGRFSGAVLVERAGRVLLRNGFGPADVTHHVPDTPATRFRVGSLTKQFTAMAILQLQAEGRLSVTDRLCQFLSPCPSAWCDITVAELLTNTSGVPVYETLPAYPRLSRQHMTPTQLVALVAARPLLFRAGTRWSYSNTGYVLLGMIVTRVSRLSYAGFLKRLDAVGVHHHPHDRGIPTYATPRAAHGQVIGNSLEQLDRSHVEGGRRGSGLLGARARRM